MFRNCFTPFLSEALFNSFNSLIHTVNKRRNSPGSANNSQLLKILYTAMIRVFLQKLSIKIRLSVHTLHVNTVRVYLNLVILHFFVCTRPRLARTICVPILICCLQNFSNLDSIKLVWSNVEVKVPIAANCKGVCLQNCFVCKPHSYHLKI